MPASSPSATSRSSWPCCSGGRRGRSSTASTSSRDPEAIADSAGYASYLSTEQKRQLLETPNVEERLGQLIAWTEAHLADVEIADKIGKDVAEGMEKSQREFLLRQQLAAIRKELGEDEAEGADDYRTRVEAADVPDDVREALLREVGKLERSSDQSPETSPGSAPGSTRCSTCRGRCGRRTTPT